MKTLREFHDELEKWHIEALLSFALYQQIRIATAPNKIGPVVAKENLTIRNKYVGVFHPMQNSSRVASFSNLTKIFIGYKNKKTGKTALSLDFLLQELKSNSLTLPNFDNKYCDTISMKLKCSKQAKELRKLRNQEIAHIDLTPETIKFSDSDFKDLLDLSNEILMFTSWCIYNNEQTEGYYNKLADDTEWDFDRLLDDLRNHSA